MPWWRTKKKEAQPEGSGTRNNTVSAQRSGPGGGLNSRRAPFRQNVQPLMGNELNQQEHIPVVPSNEGMQEAEHKKVLPGSVI